MATIPSIAMIPSGVKASKLYSVLPTDGAGDFTTTRASVATRLNESGLIEEVSSNVPRLDYSDGTCPSLLLEPASTNLITQSENFSNNYWTKGGSSVQGDPSTAGAEEVTNGDFATDSDWNKATGATISGGLLNLSGVAGGQNTFQSTSIVVGKIYKITFTVSGYVQGGLKPLIGSLGGLLPVSSNGTFTQYGIASGNSTIYLQADGTTTLSIDNVSIKEVQGFVSPKGDASAFKLVESATTGTHSSFAPTPTLSAVDYSFSVFAKASGNTSIRTQVYDGTNFHYAIFNLSTGVASNETLLNSSSIELLANGWYRCSISFTASAGVGNSYIQLIDGSNNISYTGDGTSGVYIYGFQLEQNSYATSYIKTIGTTQTRVADNATGSGNSTVINSTEGVLYAETSTNEDGLNKFITISDGTINNRISIYMYNSVNNNISCQVRSGGAEQFGKSTSGISIEQFNKIAISYKANLCKFFVNGIQVGETDILATMPSGLNTLTFDEGDSTDDFYGKVKSVQVYTTALSDAELISLTTI